MFKISTYIICLRCLSIFDSTWLPYSTLLDSIWLYSTLFHLILYSSNIYLTPISLYQTLFDSIRLYLTWSDFIWLYLTVPDSIWLYLIQTSITWSYDRVVVMDRESTLREELKIVAKSCYLTNCIQICQWSWLQPKRLEPNANANWKMR